MCCAIPFNAQSVALNTLTSARNDLKFRTDSLFKNLDYNDARSLRLAFWSVAAYNRWDKPEQNFIANLMKRMDNLSAINQYKLTAIVAKNKPDGWEAFLRKTLESGDDKLAVLSYHALRESVNTDIPHPKVKNAYWEDILRDIDNDVHRQVLDQKEIKEIVRYLRRNAADAYHIIVLADPDRKIPAQLYLLLPGSNNQYAVHGPYDYLLYSMYNLLPYFTYGHSPCGVYKIFNRDFSKNEFIGPTETLWTAVPFEIKPNRWDSKETRWTPELYRSFMPESLHNSPLMWQAYRAGAVGRYDMIIHGSTIDPENFRKEPFYPLTPSIGCLSALELWDGETGKPTVSHQEELMKLIPDKASQVRAGFMYVLQVKDNTKINTRNLIQYE